MSHLTNTQEQEFAQQKEPPSSKAEPGPAVGETFGGYECKFVESLPSAFQTECPICQLILHDPYQTKCCGINFCHSCIHQIQNDNKQCPTCRENVEVFQNKGLRRSLDQLHVFCIHSKDGCKWSGELGELEHHLNEVVHSGKSLGYKTRYVRGILFTAQKEYLINASSCWRGCQSNTGRLLCCKMLTQFPSFVSY